MQVFIILICLIGVILGKDDEQTFTALRFGTSTSDYIRFTPNLENCTSQFSVCMWAKRISPGSSKGMALSYITGTTTYYGPFRYQTVVLVGDDSLTDRLQSAFTAETGVWVHTCTTYSSETKRTAVYLDGEVAAVDTRSSGTQLTPGGPVMIGNYVGGSHSAHVFGSHMFDLNMYSRELADDEVKAMYDGGMCSTAALRDDADRAIKWEAVLELSRSGNIKEQELDFCYTLLDQQNQIDDLLPRVNQSQCSLKLEASETKVASLISQISSLDSQVSALQQKEVSIWDVVRSEGIVNQILTSQQISALTGGYAYLEHLVGVNVTEGVMELLKLVSQPPRCD